MDLDFKDVLRSAEKNKHDMFKFLRDIVAIPSESGKEREVIDRIKIEMDNVGFDKVTVDSMGNILGYIGHGKHLIAMDAHVDTVGVGDYGSWDYDPFEGYEDKEVIVGRGTSDQLGGMASLVYAGKIIKDLELENDYTLLVTGTVQEEDCEGLCWQYIIKESKIIPEMVVLSEPTACNIHLGHRGRMEIRVTTKGLSCHGSAPEQGDNAIYKIAPILTELRALNENLKQDTYLGKGSLAISEISSSSPSRCSVADSCSITLDRRLTMGENAQSAITQVENLPAVKEFAAKVEIVNYRCPSYKNFIYPTEIYLPTWLIEDTHPAVSTLKETYVSLFNESPQFGKWSFSTNGVAIMGNFGIPCVGFGPGHENQAHSPNEKTWKHELVQASAMYAVIPAIYTQKYANQIPNAIDNKAD